MSAHSHPAIEGKGRILVWRSIRIQQRLRLWFIPLLGAMTYPALIAYFNSTITGYRAFGEPSLAAYAMLLMLVAGSIPIFAARALIRVRQNDVLSPVLTRSLLHLMFAVSPLYTLTLILASKVGLGQLHTPLWVFAWIVIGLALYFRRKSVVHAPRTEGPWLRIVHGTAALFLLLGFLIAHLVNHDLAVWSVNLHRAAMEWLRLWYRSAWVEPALLTLLLVMIATGAPMVAQHSRQSADAFRAIQMATGVYLALFSCAHLLAVLGARSAGIETDWVFATGPNGLLDGIGMLIPYYIFAVFFLFLHVGCGLRIVLLKHRVAEARADRAAYTVGGIGLIVAILTAIAALGSHVQSS